MSQIRPRQSEARGDYTSCRIHVGLIPRSNESIILSNKSSFVLSSLKIDTRRSRCRWQPYWTFLSWKASGTRNVFRLPYKRAMTCARLYRDKRYCCLCNNSSRTIQVVPFNSIRRHVLYRMVWKPFDVERLVCFVVSFNPRYCPLVIKTIDQSSYSGRRPIFKKERLLLLHLSYTTIKCRD